jgi:hypothetical protein
LLFLVGPSGVGKSTVAEPLCGELALYHVDADRDRLKDHGLRDEWQEFWTGMNSAPIADALHGIASRERRAGVLLSLPSNKKRVLYPRHVEAAHRTGIDVVVLWGAEELCKSARRDRDVELGMRWDEGVYDARNRRAFATYGRPEYERLRVETFDEGGGRRRLDETVGAVRAVLEARP